MGRQQREPSPVGIVMPDLTSAKKALRRLLVHPLAKGRELDDPGTTILRKRILQEKKFLRSIYEEWYAAIANRVPRGNQPVLELGSGAGFLPLTIPDLITSDILKLPDISLVLDAHFLPFKASSLRAIVMIDVIHHLGDVRRFLHEATRCVKPGGVMVMIEPWKSPWSELIFRGLHHEPFEPDAPSWEFPASGPLSSSNQALPWIMMERDKELFAREFPQWRVKYVKPDMPFSYLASGGMTLRSLAPRFAFGAVRKVEKWLEPWMRHLAMFALIVLERSGDNEQTGM